MIAAFLELRELEAFLENATRSVQQASPANPVQGVSPEQLVHADRKATKETREILDPLDAMVCQADLALVAKPESAVFPAFPVPLDSPENAALVVRKARRVFQATKVTKVSLVFLAE